MTWDYKRREQEHYLLVITREDLERAMEPLGYDDLNGDPDEMTDKIWGNLEKDGKGVT